MNEIQKSTVEVDDGAIIFDNVTFLGLCKVGKGSTIYPNSIIINSTIGCDCEVFCSVIEDSIVSDNVKIGPFAHVRPNSVIESYCRVGNFVEIKNSTIGKGTKVSHLAYVGDAIVGKNCNIGCGAIFVNYSGKEKFCTIVGNDCFIGSNCNVIAPVTIAAHSYICAGTTLTKNTHEWDFVIGREREIIKSGKAREYLRRDDA